MTISDGDVFSAWVLTWTIYWTDSPPSELMAHLIGYLSMLKVRLDQPPEVRSRMITVFAPILYDDANSLGSSQSLTTQIREPCRLNTQFRHRMEYLGELRRAGNPSEGWYSAEIEATSLTMESLLHFSLLCFQAMVLQQRNGEEMSPLTQNMMEHLNAELRDVDFWNTINKLSEDANGRRRATFEAQLIRFQLRRLEAVQLIMSMLRSPDFLHCLNSPNIKERMNKLISNCKSEGTPGPVLQIYGDLYYLVLITGGMGLSPESDTECILSLHIEFY
jgi:hypothetical protein